MKQKDIKPLRDALILEQQGICPLCQKPLIRPSLDHNHANGKIRAVICSTCNVSIGGWENKVRRMGRKEDLFEMTKNLYEYLMNEREEIHPNHEKKRIKRPKRINKSTTLKK